VLLALIVKPDLLLHVGKRPLRLFRTDKTGALDLLQSLLSEFPGYYDIVSVRRLAKGLPSKRVVNPQRVAPPIYAFLNSHRRTPFLAVTRLFKKLAVWSVSKRLLTPRRIRSDIDTFQSMAMCLRRK